MSKPVNEQPRHRCTAPEWSEQDVATAVHTLTQQVAAMDRIMRGVLVVHPASAAPERESPATLLTALDFPPLAQQSDTASRAIQGLAAHLQPQTLQEIPDMPLDEWLTGVDQLLTNLEQWLVSALTPVYRLSGGGYGNAVRHY